MCRTLLLWLLCAFLGLPVRGSDPDLTVEIDTFERPEVIRLDVLSLGSGSWTMESVKALDAARPGRLQGYDLRYGYEENCLVPRSEERCYLHIFLADPRGRPSSGLRKVWHQTFLMTVRGAFVDQLVRLPLRVMTGGDPNSVKAGFIEVVAHSPFPADLLVPREPKEIEVSTSSVSLHDIQFANQSLCCEIGLIEAAVSSGEKNLWRTLEAIDRKWPLQPGGGNAFQPFLSLRLRPKKSLAFWSSFLPYHSARPHDMLKIDLVFEVRGGRRAEVSQDIMVRFKPPFWLVMLSLVLGATVASIIGLVVMSRRSEQGAELAFGKAEKASEKLAEVSKRILLSVLVSVAVFFLYQVIKGERDVILFDFALDPYQCLPAFVIGLLVGSRPDFYYRRLIQGGGDPGGGAQAAVGTSILFIFLLGMIPISAQAQPSDFRPTVLGYDQMTDMLYVVSSAPNRLYKLNPATASFQEIANIGSVLGHGGIATDACFVQSGGKSWMATVLSRVSRMEDTWQVTIALIPGLTGSMGPIRRSLGFSQLYGVAYDESMARLLFTDRVLGGIFSAPVTSNGIGKPVRLLSHRLLSEPTAIAAKSAGVFVASRERQTVYRVDLETEKVTPLVEDLLDPAAIAVSQDGKRLFVVDAGEAQIHEHILATGAQRIILKGSPLREPRALQVDRRGHLWVADAWARIVFEFSPEGKLLRRHFPSR